MFTPKHSIESVTRELIEGLDHGTIVLRAEDLPKVSVPEFAAELNKSLLESRSKARWVLATQIALAVVCLTAYLVFAHLNPSNQTFEANLSRGFFVIFGLICGIFSSSLYSYFRTRTIELKTYVRILKMADAETAEKIATRTTRKGQLMHN